jgi:hypothetical protein
VPGADVGGVERPASALLGVSGELDLDDEREDDAIGSAEEEDEVGASLDGRHGAEVGLAERDLGAAGDGDAERGAEEVDRELGPLAEQVHQQLVGG